MPELKKFRVFLECNFKEATVRLHHVIGHSWQSQHVRHGPHIDIHVLDKYAEPGKVDSCHDESYSIIPWAYEVVALISFTACL